MKAKNLFILYSGLAASISFASATIYSTVTLTTNSSLSIEACASSSRYWETGCDDAITNSGTSKTYDSDSDAEYLWGGVMLSSPTWATQPPAYNLQGSCANYHPIIQTDDSYNLYVYLPYTNPMNGSVNFTADATVDTSGNGTLILTNCNFTTSD